MRVGHGLYRRSDATDLQAWQLVLPPSGRFTHLTAAAALGWSLPPLPAALPIFVALERGDSRPQRAGVVARRTERLPAPQVLDEVRLDPPEEILLSCARELGVLDLVVLADSAVHRGDVTLADLRTAASARRRGAPRLRHALHLVDARSESPYESLLRVLHQVCDVDVEPQHVLYDDAGSFIARGDLWLRGTTTFHEYDGGDHLEVRQQRRDLSRTRRIGNRLWTRRGYTAADVLRQGVGILRDADLSLGRPHDPTRIRAWHRLLAGSLFTASGQEQFRRAVRLGPRSNG